MNSQPLDVDIKIGGQPKKLVLMDHLSLLPKDPSLMAANRAEAKWQRKAKEDKRREKQQKLRMWERGEEIDSDEDDDEEEEEVVTDTKRDDLESKDTLIGIPSSMQGPFLFHAGGSESVRTAEAG